MKCKKLMCFALSLVLSAGLFSGCGKGGSDPDSPDSPASSSEGSKVQEGATGRYGETDIPLPEGADNPFGILWEEDALTLYTSGSSEDQNYLRYRLENQTWSEPEPVAWMNDAADRLGLAVSYLYPGADGKIYAMAFPCKDGIPYGQHILVSEDGSTALDLTPDSLKEPDEQVYRPYILDLAVLSDGTLALGLASSVAFYKDGKQISQMDSIPICMDHQTMLAASPTTVAVYNPDGTSVDLYQTQDLKKLQNVPVDQDLIESFILPGTEGDWYLIASGGIMRFTENGSILETLMEGSYGLMGSSAASMKQFLCGPEKDFYGLYLSHSGDRSGLLKHYVYEDGLPASTSASLSIYGLKESETVKQAVFEFQQLHPEVQVQYNFAAGSFETPSPDAIRSLNAELLNGGGADVLLLDGLPLDSYMEKGVLCDLSDLADRLKEEDVLMEVIGTTAQKDGKTYALPARVGIPLVFGTSENMAALESLDALHSYIQSHSGESLFGKTSHDLLGMTLFHTMYEELLLEDGSLDEKNLAALLSDWMQICQDSQIPQFEEAFDISPFWDSSSFSFQTGGMYPSGKDFAAVEEMRGLSSTMISFTKIREEQLELKGLRDYYIPHVIAGVNSSSPQQELAKEFIEALYSDSVQSLDSYEGFSVTNHTLDALADFVETDAAKEVSVSSSYLDPDTGEMSSLNGAYPTREQVEDLTGLIRQTRTPFRMDSSLSDTVLAELESCYQNLQTPEETAASICQKVRLYLAE